MAFTKEITMPRYIQSPLASRVRYEPKFLNTLSLESYYDCLINNDFLDFNSPWEIDIILKKFDLIDIIDFMKRKEYGEMALEKIVGFIEDLIKFKDYTCYCRYKQIDDYLLIVKENKPNMYKWFSGSWGYTIKKIKITKELQLRFILSDRELTKLDWVIG